MFSSLRYLKENADKKALYPKLKNVDAGTISSATNDPGFEAVAAAYLKVSFDQTTFYIRFPQ